MGLGSIKDVYADPTYRIAVTGDISCSSNGQNTVKQITNQNPSLVLWLGDLSYVDSDVNCFISKTSQLASKDEAIIGNHDDSEDGSSGARTQLINHFGIPSSGYYAKTFDVAGTQRTDDILLIGMDTQTSITTSSSQYTFVQNALKNSNSPLKIVMVHKPFVSCTCEHSSNGQFSAYHALFKQYGVDLVLQGHNHNVQYFNSIDNIKYIVSGAGGRSHYTLSTSPQPAHYRDDSNYGFTLIDANFATNEFQGKFITSTGIDRSTSHFAQSFAQISLTPPVANAQTVTTAMNAAKSITLVANDPNNDPLTYSIVAQPLHGTVTTGTGAIRTYTPTTNYIGSDSFTFKANDGTLDSNIATVNINVQNGPPIANSQEVNVIKNTQTSLTLTATDPNNDPLTYVLVARPVNGILSGTSPNLIYYPNPDYVGSDSFTFKVNDGATDSNTATVGITVQEPSQQGSYRFSPSLALTGSNYQDTLDSSSLRLTQFSLATWFKTSTNFASDAFIVNKGGVGSDSAGQNLNYGIWMTSAEQIKAGFETSTGADQYVTSPSTYNDGKWHYVMVTNNGANVVLYIDDVQVATKATSGASPENTGTKPVRVGANSRVTPPGNFFTGEVDEIRIWNSALSASQVSAAFGGTFPPGHVLHLPFGGGSGGGYNYAPSLVLTGSNSQDANSPSLSQFSLASWFKTTSNFASDGYIANKGGVGSDSTGQNLNYGIWMTSAEQIKAGFETSTGADQYVTSPSTYNDGQWHYAVVTNSGTTVVLYIDGVQVATKATSGASPEQNTKPFRVGANARVDPPASFFTGEVDEIRVWNDDLTATQLSNAFAGTDFMNSKQILYLHFTTALTSSYTYGPSLYLSETD